MRAAVDWDALDARSEAQLTRAAVADADNPPLDAAFWARAQVVQPAAKRAVSLRIDGDVLDWFRSRGRGYQTRINAVLRSYVAAQRR
ncbi:MAG: BrnA antitoxin family protein [Alphaproteobacteria bacterium]|nr:BrnA antitoxin family protein [Alphaproteobacteria bacterium]